MKKFAHRTEDDDPCVNPAADVTPKFVPYVLLLDSIRDTLQS